MPTQSARLVCQREPKLNRLHAVYARGGGAAGTLEQRQVVTPLARHPQADIPAVGLDRRFTIRPATNRRDAGQVRQRRDGCQDRCCSRSVGLAEMPVTGLAEQGIEVKIRSLPERILAAQHLVET